MDKTVTPGLLQGRVAAIASKSDAHRLLICAALADAPTRLAISTTSRDIEATASCLRALGAKIVAREGELAVTPIAATLEEPLLDCSESGSTFRFLLPVACAVSAKARFTGAGRLPERPIGELMRAMRKQGVAFDAERLPFTTQGRLRPGRFELPGNVSSQYVSGLLFALPILAGDSEIALTTPLESAPYVAMTLSSLARFGIKVQETQTGWRVPGGQRYRSPGGLAVEADWSNAAFFLAAGAAGGPVTVAGLARDSVQGDKAVVDCLRAFGARVTVEGSAFTVRQAPLRAITVDLREIPDALPILAVLATRAQGTTRFIHGERLRIKESDRLAAVADMLKNLGARVAETADGLAIEGSPLAGGTVQGRNDHRIVMAASIAATFASGPVTITDAQAVSKSYPGYWEDFELLGGIAHG